LLNARFTTSPAFPSGCLSYGKIRPGQTPKL
jgi:hypothetical protein